MPNRFNLMHASAQFLTHRQLGSSIPPAALVAVTSVPPAEEDRWDGPTLRELVERVEHQFGQAPALSGVFMLGFAPDEPLTPGDIQAVCDHLGLPAEDFGLDP